MLKRRCVLKSAPSSFIFAGQDTTSHALCRLFDQLAKNPVAQDKLRREIISARQKKSGKDFDYDELMSLPYLDAVCRETLRLFPPVMFLGRE